MKKIFIVAGEPSGDVHASHLIASTKKMIPDIHFYGMGGKEMQKAGAEIIIDYSGLAVIGLTEIFPRIPLIYRTFQRIKNLLRYHPPDLLILVDYPGFNLRLAKVAKKLGIKVVYYISPTLWAWKPNRIKIIKKCVEKMAVIFPFEKKFYEERGVLAAYVGNSLTAQIQPTLEKESAFKYFNLDPNKKVIGILPGSRSSEIKNLLPQIIAATISLKAKYKDLQIVLPLANSIDESEIRAYLEKAPFPILVVRNQTYNLLQLCDAVIAASGTITLEIAFLGIPQVIIYKLSPITYRMARLFVKIKLFGLCNIVANKLIAKELLQEEVTEENIAAEITRILEDEQYKNEMCKGFQEVREAFNDKTIIEPIEKVIAEVLGKKLLSQPMGSLGPLG